ncbi:MULTISPECIES: triose-phosphate isomerase [Janthinobacterium]|uniref:triose-phosphate isomerase n=1 Tax=Janthinobacterium TaxID=29580 RepID=UPI0008FC5944|nr:MULTISPECIES: triose-phosphate isomerase [Janthinobacterium]MBR7635565.1 triose-phosphate isomerase [Janthinobacterium lividum]MDO8034332.1 triose-phosphate isomerase [Janthinobacterium sp. SUN128]PHV23700.1 triose-phosphate isomerase [Janthinobacterium sp. BJB446]PHV51795.1 triose-phosphate isomerase [Janthinobacterium sp. BJB301]QKY10177.1 triose-phosphate isomerase [Janthinobacterium lividum]
MRRKLVVGNWKMNGSRTSNAVLLSEIVAGLAASGAASAVCVPAPYLAQCQAQLAGTALGWGAQDVSAHAGGAYTGEISTAMLQDFGCGYVVIGHSERRAYHGESDAQVAAKTVAALAAGITPIVCIGETLAQREAGQTNAVVAQQLGAVLAAISADDVAKLVLAYEPVWAIGTGKTATPQMAQDVHQVLRAQLVAKNAVAAAGVQILYGGSMKPENAKELMAMPDIDGGLIGGAALKAADFLAIIHAAD